MELKSEELKKFNRSLSQINRRLREAMLRVPAGITQRLVIGANDIRNTIIESMMREKKSGKLYRRGSRLHQASAPGEPPATDSGDMVKSVIFDVRSMEVEVGSIITNPPYPRMLEEGTSEMGPRPWLWPAIEEHGDDIIKDVGIEASDIIADAVKGSLK